MGEVFSFKLFITKNIKFMKKYFFMAVATLVVSAAAIVGIKSYHYYSMPELMKANLEALTNQGENNEHFEGYKNVTDQTTLGESRVKTEYDPITGAENEVVYVVKCVVYHTYCKSASDSKVCHTILNGTVKECEE